MKTQMFLLSLLLGCVSLSAESTGTWTPKISFQLEDGDSTQTLIWVSGWAYAITEAGRSNVKKGRTAEVCLEPGQVVDSRFLIDTLNAKFTGQRISSEQASSTMWTASEARYKCVRK